MNKPTQEDIVAYVDGRLDRPARAAFEVRLKDDPELARQAEAHRWMARQIVAAFGAPPGDEVDEADLARFGLSGGNVVAFPAEPRRTMRRSAFAAILGGAIAASLVVGVFLDRTVSAPPPGMLQAGGTGQVFARGELASSLSGRLSGAPGDVKIGLSFRTAHTVCRTFSTAHGLSGLGCRDGQRWVVPMVAAEQSGVQGPSEYRLAGGDVAPPVMAEVDRRMVGEPLSPAQEKALMASDWQARR